MMRTYVQLRDGLVVNRTIFDGDMPEGWAAGDEWIASEEAQIGWSYTNGRFAAPPRSEPPPEQHRATMREERDTRLRETDWTQLADSPVDKARWAIYRQQLRDLPANTPDPAKPSWPRRPDDPDTQAAERELDRAARTILFDGKN